MTATLDLARFRSRLAAAPTLARAGRVRRLVGMTLEAEGLPGEIGELCLVKGARGDVPVEIVGFHGERTTLLPLERLEGIADGAVVTATGAPFAAPVGDGLLGRVLDGLGRPLDGRGELRDVRHRPLIAAPPAAMSRPAIARRFETGVRSIDLLTTLGEGQRVGIFAGSGVGKSTLLGKILREAKADVTVLALIGERNREVRDFVDKQLGPAGLKRAVVVAATSDRPALQRMKAAHLAATIAEEFRDAGRRVLMVMDSATRFAMALREAGLAAGEPPATRGYPPSLYAELPRLVERFGTAEKGSITALLTVLVEGDDLNDPVADCLRGLLDGHLVLSRNLAERGHYPPVDPLKSLSRLMDQVTVPRHLAAAQKLRHWLALHEDHRDLIEIGAYRKGSEPLLDKVLEKLPQVNALLRQAPEERTPFETALAALAALVELPPAGAADDRRAAP
ncbi:MAG: FliI/YscN family ATPase [Planctomycetes bacterium]|nr:FliI/YscN family ATPase [Planctomycetota bacterium]